MPEFTATQISNIDQNLATLNTEVDTLVKAYKILTAQHGDTKGLLMLSHRVNAHANVDRDDMAMLIATMARRLASVEDQAGGDQ